MAQLGITMKEDDAEKHIQWKANGKNGIYRITVFSIE